MAAVVEVEGMEVMAVVGEVEVGAMAVVLLLWLWFDDLRLNNFMLVGKEEEFRLPHDTNTFIRYTLHVACCTTYNLSPIVLAFEPWILP
jgi:hypothetical protein